MYIVFLGGYHSYPTLDIKLKASAFLSCVEVTKSPYTIGFCSKVLMAFSMSFSKN